MLKRIFKFFAWTALVLGMTLLLIGASLYLYSRTDSAKAQLKTLIQNLFAANLNGRLDIGTIEIDFPNTVKLQSVTVHVAGEEAPSVQLDSAVVKLSLTRSIFGGSSQRFFITRLRLVQPHLKLIESDSILNVLRLLPPADTTAPASDAQIPILVFNSVEIEKGDVVWTRMPHKRMSGEAVERLREFGIEPVDLEDIHLAEIQLLANAELTLGAGRNHVVGSIKEFSFKIPSREFELKSLTADFALTEARTDLSRFTLETNRSDLSLTASLDRFNIFTAEAPDGFDKLKSALTVRSKKLDTRDLKLFAPELYLAGGVYQIDLDATGDSGNADLKQFRVAAASSVIDASGKIYNAFEPERLRLDMKLTEGTLRVADLKELLPYTKIPAGTAALGTVRVRGKHQGTLNDFRSSLSFESKAGSGSADLNVKLRGKQPPSYAGKVDLRNFNLALLTGDASLASNITVSGEVEGRGTSIATLDSKFKGRMSESVIAGRRVSSMEVDIVAKDKKVVGNIVGRNRDQEAKFTGTVDFSGDDLAYSGEGAVKNVNLAEALLDTSWTSSLTARYELNGSGTSLGRINSRFYLDFDSSTFNGRPIPKGTKTTVVLRQLADSAVVDIQNGLFDFVAEGRFNIDRLLALATREAALVEEEIYRNNIYRTEKQERNYQRVKTQRKQLETAALDSLLDDADITYKLRLKDLAPIVEAFRTPYFNAAGELSGKIVAKYGLRQITANLTLDSVRYTKLFAARDITGTLVYGDSVSSTLGDNLFRSVTVRQRDLADTGRVAAKLNVSVPRIRINDQRFSRTALFADYEPKGLYLNFRTTNSNSKGLVDFETFVSQKNNRYFADIGNLTFATSDYLWQSTPGGRLSLSRDLIDIEKFQLSNGDQLIDLGGRLDLAGSGGLSLDIKNFDLSEIKQFIFTNPDERLTGKINLRVDAVGNLNAPKLDFNLYADELAYNVIDVGNLNLYGGYRDKQLNFIVDANRDTLRTDSLKLKRYGFNHISGYGNIPIDLSASPAGGKLFMETEDVSAVLFSDDLNVKVLEFFLPFLTNVSGAATVDARLSGRFPKPDIAVTLRTDNANALVTQTNVYYTMKGEFKLTPDKLEWKNATFTDDAQGRGRTSGDIKMNFFAPDYLDITTTFSRLRLLNLSRAQGISSNQAGTLVARARDLHFYGALDRPKLDGTITIADGSDFILFNNKSSSSALYAGAGKYLVFREREDTTLEGRLRRDSLLNRIVDEYALDTTVKRKSTISESLVDALEMNLQIRTDGRMTFGIVFDPYLGEEMITEIEAALSLQKRGTRYSTLGKADVLGGRYNYYGKVFTLRQGGTLRWNNSELLEADMNNLFAEHNTRVRSEKESGSEYEDVDLMLFIAGDISKPDMEFGYKLTNDNRQYHGTKKDGSASSLGTGEIDPNAFLNWGSILISREWFSDPRRGGGDVFRIGSLATAGLSAGTGLLSSQLSRLAGNINGVRDVNIGVASDRSGNVAGIDFKVSYAVPGTDDKLIVTGGGSTATTSTAAAQSQSSILSNTTLRLEYRLSTRLSLQAFRTIDQSGTSITSQNPEVWGAGVAYREDFRSWGELGTRWSDYFLDVTSWFSGKAREPRRRRTSAAADSSSLRTASPDSADTSRRRSSRRTPSDSTSRTPRSVEPDSISRAPRKAPTDSSSAPKPAAQRARPDSETGDGRRRDAEEQEN